MGWCQQVDSFQYQMKDVEVKAYRLRGYLSGAPLRELHWNMSMMQNLPQILSNADPIHYLQLLPSVQTNSDIDAGFHIQGCATGQSLTLIGDAPVYNPSHLLGLFSTFNASHYKELVFRTFGETSTPNVLGGTIQFSPHQEITDTIHGTMSVGILSSQGTLHVPLHRNHSITISARGSYLNLLYGNFMKIEDSKMRYSFEDYNLSYAAKLSKYKISINAFYSRDKGRFGKDNLDLGLDMRWQNYMASLTIDHKPLSWIESSHQSLYFSGYSNITDVAQNLLNGSLPSSIKTYGYKLQLTNNFFNKLSQRLNYGLELQHNLVQPQNLEIEASYNIANSLIGRQHASQASFFAEYVLQPKPWFEINAGVRLNAYHIWNDSTATYVHPDPFVLMTFRTREFGVFNMRVNRQHQYIHQAGFSSIGLPTEFRFTSSAIYKPQSAISLSIGYEHDFFDRRYRLKTELYAKQLNHQIEYHGDLMSFYTVGYSMDQTLVSGRGYNFGINLQLIKQTGRLTGWLSYSYGRSMRRFDVLSAKKWYPSNYERPHELNAVLNYKLGHHWSFGGTFVFASGTPFTAIKYAYFMSEAIVAQYGEHNTNRLAPYSRLDMSATYEFQSLRSQRLQHGLNLSIYNVLCRKNEIHCMLKIKNNTYQYRTMNFFIRTMPSINYYIRF